MTEKSSVPYDTISKMSVSSQSVLDKCCCCFPMRTGCFILGYLHLTFNAIQTLSIIAFATFIGVLSHGFDHFDSEVDETNRPLVQETTAEDPELAERQHIILTHVGYILAVMLVANVAWMIINTVCLVGLHKKRPGPIRVYIGFATARVMLSLASFIYLVMSNRMQSRSIVMHSFDIALSTYFIMVYYIYAGQLQKERDATASANNVYVYPKLDKSHLVA